MEIFFIIIGLLFLINFIINIRLNYWTCIPNRDIYSYLKTYRDISIYKKNEDIYPQTNKYVFFLTEDCNDPSVRESLNDCEARIDAFYYFKR